MRVAAVLFAAGVLALVWLRHTARLDDTPKWKPDQRPINNNRNRP